MTCNTRSGSSLLYHQPVLEGFLDCFRAYFGEAIVRDSDKFMVSVVERGDSRTTESVARYLEHGLRVCREEGVKVFR